VKESNFFCFFSFPVRIPGRSLQTRKKLMNVNDVLASVTVLATRKSFDVFHFSYVLKGKREKFVK
jgi:hypothetical protein